MARLASRPATRAEWQAAFEATAGATFVQSPAWYEAAGPLMSSGYGVKTHILELPGGPVVVPLWERPAGGWLRQRWDVQANARGLYAGWLRKEPLEASERAAVAAWLAGRSRLMAWRANPFQGVRAEAWAEFGPVEPEDTYLIDLKQSPDALWSGYASGMRSDVNRTRTAGVTCRLADRPEDWSGYVDLYEETLARWGGQATNRYSGEFLVGLSGLDGCRLWVAEHEGALVAGAIHFYHGPHVLGWHLANRLGVAKLSPTKLLIHEVILDAQRRGLSVYDLNVSGGHAGPERWKQLMGAKATPAPFIRREPPAMRGERLRKAAAKSADASQAASGAAA